MDFRLILVLLSLASLGHAQKYSVKIKHGDEIYDGLVEVNVQKGEEIYKTGFSVAEDGSEPKVGLDAAYTVRDVNKKLDAFVDEQKSICYLSTYDANTEVSPVDLKEDLESQGVNAQDDIDIVDMQKTAIEGDPIEDVASVSSVIAKHCADKTTYWTVTTEEEMTCDGAPCDLQKGIAGLSRDVRFCLSWGFEWKFEWKWTCGIGGCSNIRVRVKVKVCISFG